MQAIQGQQSKFPATERVEPLRILLIDDDEDDYLLTRELISEIEHQTYDLDWANSFETGLSQITQNRHDVYIIDYRLGHERNGVELMKQAIANGCRAPIIMLTAVCDRDIDLEARSAGACDYLLKGHTDARTIERSISYALDRARIMEQLRDSNERFALAARGTNDGLWDWNVKTRQVYFSPRWKMMLGYADDEIENRIEEWFDRVHPDDLERVKAVITAHLAGLTRRFQNEYRIKNRDGAYLWMLSRALGVRDESGRVTRIAGSQTDITDRKLAETKRFEQTLFDSVTSLPNAALFKDRLQTAIERAKRNVDRSFGLLALDIHEFQSIDRRYGKGSADELLVQFSRALLQCVRPTDTVSRLMRDEFVILLEEVRNRATALKIAHRIHKAINTTYQIGGCKAGITVSIGVRVSAGTGLIAEQLLQEAELALYRAKARGRGQVVAFEDASPEILRLKRA